MSDQLSETAGNITAMSQNDSRVPIPVIIILLSFLCPTEFSLDIAGLRLPPHRVALLLLLPLALTRMVLSRQTRIRSFDIVFILYGISAIASYTYHAAQAGFIYGGSLALEAVGGYFIARAFVRNTEQLRATMRIFIVAIVIAALFALPETLLGHLFTHDFLHKLTGYHHPVGVQTRLGLTRAYGTFDHPIHYGTFCAALLAMFWFVERRAVKRRINATIMTAATFLGLSSAPMLCLGLQGGMLAWDRFTRTVRNRVALTLMAIAGLYLAMSLVSNRTPFAIIATGMTLDPWTGFYRLMIWDYGLDNIWQHPWIGIGLGEWSRPWWMISDTIDAFWLVTAVRQGIPSFLLLALAIGLLAYDVVKRSRRHADPVVPRIAMGWMMSLIALCLVGATVHYWNVLHSYFFFFIGLGAWMADPARSALVSFAKAEGRAPARRTDRKKAGPIPLNWPEPDYGRPYGHPGLAQAPAIPYGRPYRVAN
ncbi:MAG: O-antigen ligase family protein [Hyphomicrobiaceae bacterium]|nr:O-antigen ligase family protein [Hyphomicrobiaceae bacterium]MCC0011041.1 O-antigen ligase family protein [Hyphomicrobiaceae bacterium]